MKMKQTTNCPNCGAALDIWADKCEFCGTRNINLTAIDFADERPANFIMRARIQQGDIYIATCAIPHLKTVENNCDTITVTGGWGNTPLITYDMGRSLDFNIQLQSVHSPHNDELARVTFKGD